MTILILEIRCNVYVLQQLFRVPKIVTFLLLVIAPSSSSPYILYAFALLQGTHAGFHVRMGAFCHVQKLLTACCRPHRASCPFAPTKLAACMVCGYLLTKATAAGKMSPAAQNKYIRFFRSRLLRNTKCLTKWQTKWQGLRR